MDLLNIFRRRRIRSRAFIVGCPRSGTTLLQALLAAHPSIRSFPESHFFTCLEPRRELARRFHVAARSSRKSLQQYSEAIGIRRPWLRPFCSVKTRYREFRGILDAACLQKGGCCWIEKTPIHLHYIDLIQRLDPTLKFIHIIREGLHVTASLREVTRTHSNIWGGERSIETCVARWLEDVEMSLSRIGHPNHVHVLYEDLVAHPEKELQKLSVFLGMEYVSEMLSDYQKSSDGIVGQSEVWKAQTKRPISSTGSAKAKRVLTPEEHTFAVAATAGVWTRVLSKLSAARHSERSEPITGKADRRTAMA